MRWHSAADRCELTEQQVCFALKEMTTHFLPSFQLDFQAFTVSDCLFSDSDLTCSFSLFLSVCFLILTSHLFCFTRKSCLMSGSVLYPWACGHVSLVFGILLLVSLPLLTTGTTSNPTCPPSAFMLHRLHILADGWNFQSNCCNKWSKLSTTKKSPQHHQYRIEKEIDSF